MPRLIAPSLGALAMLLLASADGHAAGAPDLSVIDAAKRAVVKRIPAGRSPWGIARGQ